MVMQYYTAAEISIHPLYGHSVELQQNAATVLEHRQTTINTNIHANRQIRVIKNT